METSFIPKKTYKKKTTKRRDYGGLFMGIAGLIFIISILAAGSVFLYDRYLNSDIERMSSDLERQKGSLEKEIIKELSKIDKKIEASKMILDNHITLISLFELLEKNTLKNVMFENMVLSPEDGGWTISMKGLADSYATIALQSDVFEEDKNMSELIFSDLAVGNDGGVVFDVTAKIDPRILSYRNSLE